HPSDTDPIPRSFFRRCSPVGGGTDVCPRRSLLRGRRRVMAQPSQQSWSERIRQLKEVLPIDVLIGQYFTLVPEGTRYLRAREHDGLFADRHSGRYPWTARGESGDVVDFVCRQEGLSVPEALARLDALPLSPGPVASSGATSHASKRAPHLGVADDLLPVL